jgi:hypothetical protein
LNTTFPGNVRELEHIVERAVILADGSTIERKHLPVRFLQDLKSTRSMKSRQFSTLAEMEKRYIVEVLEASQGNKSKTAEILGHQSRSAVAQIEAAQGRTNRPMILPAASLATKALSRSASRRSRRSPPGILAITLQRQHPRKESAVQKLQQPIFFNWLMNNPAASSGVLNPKATQ